ncbi:hypothetical protein P171DRAFT_219707 [Karstenula rhodostoma CBS 690.94]|uniref:Uncharacterized protein n=1 Tax=Karstenula rhodostoma CBS 690.94 TaxID=1392251 RepID=A0A9P4PPC0_9PLEO|nr:hypothetical protein P171DRAFT_219707 [Karstenula rhodostoma CBS 690.94]
MVISIRRRRYQTNMGPSQSSRPSDQREPRPRRRLGQLSGSQPSPSTAHGSVMMLRRSKGHPEKRRDDAISHAAHRHACVAMVQRPARLLPTNRSHPVPDERKFDRNMKGTKAPRMDSARKRVSRSWLACGAVMSQRRSTARDYQVRSVSLFRLGAVPVPAQPHPLQASCPQKHARTAAKYTAASPRLLACRSAFHSHSHSHSHSTTMPFAVRRHSCVWNTHTRKSPASRYGRRQCHPPPKRYYRHHAVHTHRYLPGQLLRRGPGPA